MTKQTKEKLTKLTNHYTSADNIEDENDFLFSVFGYVDDLVANERRKIIADFGRIIRKYHHGFTPKKYNMLILPRTVFHKL